MEPQTDKQAVPNQSEEGDVVRALNNLDTCIENTGDALDELAKRLDPILLDLHEPDMKSVAKEAQSRSPLAGLIHLLAGRVTTQRSLLERLCEMLQL